MIKKKREFYCIIKDYEEFINQRITMVHKRLKAYKEKYGKYVTNGFGKRKRSLMHWNIEISRNLLERKESEGFEEGTCYLKGYY